MAGGHAISINLVSPFKIQRYIYQKLYFGEFSLQESHCEHCPLPRLQGPHPWLQGQTSHLGVGGQTCLWSWVSSSSNADWWASQGWQQKCRTLLADQQVKEATSLLNLKRLKSLCTYLQITHLPDSFSVPPFTSPSMCLGQSVLPTGARPPTTVPELGLQVHLLR